MSLRIIFMGTPQYSVPTLSALIAAGHEIVAVYSQPPRRSGRGMAEKKSPVHELAQAENIPVFTPASLKNEDERARFITHNIDLAVVVAYGLILPKPILDAPRLGCINGHASLLPRWRGAAPIQRAIEAGDTESGVMIMQMETGLDTGPVMLTQSIAINSDMSAGDLHDELSTITASLMVKAITLLENGEAGFTPQLETGLTYAKKLEKSETRIAWNRPAIQVHNHIRAMSPFPGAWCEMEIGGKPVRVKILKSAIVTGQGKAGEILDDQLTVACNEGAIRPVHLQKAGKQLCDLDEFLRGNTIIEGTVLS